MATKGSGRPPREADEDSERLSQKDIKAKIDAADADAIANDDSVMEAIADKNAKPGGFLDDAYKAPDFIRERYKSDPAPPPESRDVEFLTEREAALGMENNTLDYMAVPDSSIPDGQEDCYSERCLGRNPETRKLMVVRLKARKVKIRPDMVMRYRGHVVQDHLSTHSFPVPQTGGHVAYVFDRFFNHNGQKLSRCCLVLDRKHQAYMMYEKLVDKQNRRPYAVIRRMRGQFGQRLSDPTYEVVGQSEGYYRDLKRLFERHYLYRGSEALAEDIGLKMLISGRG